MNSADSQVLYQDDVFTLTQADFCGIPGYLIVRLRTASQSLGDLPPHHAARLGELLTSAVTAIEKALAADRVYCLSFCEIDRRLHFHLFPRTTGLLEAYFEATGTEGQPINGPLLFEWARDAYPAGGAVPPGSPSLQEVGDRLRSLLG
ncbi:MAG: hypothetical protein K8J08_12985 [Thermoanaerobaculia bacterium]|nr:hypothetical protein [Thermoanaerobaculia bacterium]